MDTSIQLKLKGELLDDIREIAETKEISIEQATIYILDLYHLRAKNLVKTAHRASERVLYK